LALGVSTLVGLSNTVVQERAPAEIRGRVSAIAGLSFFGLLPFAGMIMAALADWIQIRPALLTAAIAYAVIGCFVLLWAGKAAGEEIA
jgi:MFS family permease